MLDRAVTAAASTNVRSVVLCNTMVYGVGLGLKSDSDQVPRLVSAARDAGVARHIGPGENIWSNVHLDDVCDLYLRALQSATPGSSISWRTERRRSRTSLKPSSPRETCPAPSRWTSPPLSRPGIRARRLRPGLQQPGPRQSRSHRTRLAAQAHVDHRLDSRHPTLTPWGSGSALAITG
ncbi:NAD-dependent epimerase/dehydratase family protein [[Actinomadura] parvosata]|uniref:NAD-dependent epimerase/dehydratase family protein n=1 Tax=[Actinomadura] parvosata TaxID=1955412 RepID=UPI00406D4ACA